MINSSYELNQLQVMLPITQQGRDMAQQFANQYASSGKREQIWLNTLAVWIVKDYLDLLGVPTNLSESDSWSSVMQLAGNIADLEVEGLGKLECRPIRQGEKICPVPPETWDLRIGYLVVEIDDSYRRAKVLGFVQEVNDEVLPVDALMPLEDFIDYLDERQTAAQPSTTSAQSASRVNLTQWFSDIFETGWQQIDALLNPQDLAPAYSFRSARFPITNAEREEPIEDADIERAKLINLGIQFGQHRVILVVRLKRETAQKTEITLQLHPEAGQAFLMPDVTLQVLDATSEVFMQTQARDSDNYVQLKFSGESGERFQVLVALDDAVVTEQFIV